MEHTHPPYRHIILHASVICWVKPKFYVPILQQSIMYQAMHCINNFTLYGVFKIQLKISFINFKTSHLDACILMEHAHPSYAHIVFNMLGQIQVKILCSNPTPILCLENFSFTCMHLYGTCPSIICTHNI